MEEIILVDEKDNVVGFGEKLDVHRKGLLHRAFSIYVFNDKEELMVQKRASEKYHSGGLWTNTCCSHQRKGEELINAVHRRLKEEMGFDCPLQEVDEFIYKVKFNNGLTEHEYLHVFTGIFNGNPKINPEEADGWKWMLPENILDDMESNPDEYTYWFRKTLPRVLD